MDIKKIYDYRSLESLSVFAIIQMTTGLSVFLLNKNCSAQALRNYLRHNRITDPIEIVKIWRKHTGYLGLDSYKKLSEWRDK